jgi:uncharacterized protein YqcC (DUF446 family)
MSTTVSALLDELEQTMKKENVWQEVSPSADKMRSREPFSIDTLNVIEWVQWVYLSRLRELLLSNQPLPVGANVAPYAEEALRSMKLDLPELIAVLKKLDGELG